MAASSSGLPPHLAVRGFDSLSVLHRDERVLVLRGTKLDTNEPVILKTRPTGLAGGAQTIAQEYELLKQLRASGATVEPLAFFCHDGLDVLVIKARPAETTQAGSEYLSTNGALDLKAFFPLAVALTTALGRIHSQHIVHGDVKPGNFLFSPDDGHVLLFDFDLAFPFNSNLLGVANAPRGTFPYIAPECTGRIGAQPDHRSDLYSLGVTLFQMLTDSLPFSSELLHAILTENPMRVTVVRPSIPNVLSDIVAKLLLKDPERRYQSAYGVHKDLLRCKAEFEATGNISSFEIGQNDAVIVLQQPRKLYGREKESHIVQNMYNLLRKRRVCGLFLRGEPGAGKSSFVRILPSLVERSALYGRGRFEQMPCQAPFKAIGEALSSVIQRIVSLDDALKRPYVERLRRELGHNASLLYEVLPSLRGLISDTSVPTTAENDDIPSQAVQARFADTLTRLIACCATRERPLILCMDDLQWADSTSLSLVLQLLTGLTSPELHELALLFVGAYRLNDPATPLVSSSVGKLREGGLAIEEIELSSLAQADVMAILRDAFPNSKSAALSALCDAVQRKTLGNAFFVLHFLGGLFQDGLVRFDFDTGLWTFDMSGIEAAKFTDNVATFLSQRLTLRPEAERELLFAASCLGNEAPLSVLQKVLQMEQPLFDSVVKNLTSAHWLTLCGSNGIAFSHDHLFEAARGLYSEERRHAVHYRIAELLYSTAAIPPTYSELFAIVQQYNKAGSAVPRERHQVVVALNLDAWERAKVTAAHHAAYEAAQAAQRIVEQEEGWWKGETRDLCFRTTLALYICQSDLAHHKEANATYAYLLTRVDNEDDRIDVWMMRAEQLELQSCWQESIAIRLDVLRLLGVTLPMSPTPADTQEMLQSAVAAFNSTKTEISSLPFLTGKPALALTFLSQLVPATFHAAPAVYTIAAAKLVTTALQNKCVVPALGVGLVALATALVALGQQKLAIEMSRHAMNFLNRVEGPVWRCKAYLMMLCFTLWYDLTWEACLPIQIKASKLSVESGDTHAVCYLVFVGDVLKFCAGMPLPRLEAECEMNCKWLSQHLISLPVRRNIRSVLSVISALTGTNTSTLKEIADPSTYDTAPLALHYSAEVMRCHLTEQYQEGYAIAQTAKKCVLWVKSLCWAYWYWFHYCLILFALYPSVDDKNKELYRTDIKECMTMISDLATYAPQNFLGMHLLLKAESVRVLNSTNSTSAIQLYDEALQHAKVHKMPVVLAIASELAGLFYLSLNASITANAHLCTAYHTYMEWGAVIKVKALVARLPFVDFGANRTHQASSSPSITNSVHAQMDVESVVKASRVLTTELSLAHILNNVMTVIVENSGAERAFILLTKGKDKELEVAARHEHAGQNSDRMSRIVIAMAARDKTLVVAENAVADNRFLYDEYVQEKRVRSVLCIPMQSKDELQGLVYLENNSFSGAFLPARIPVLCVLVSQLAISIENSSMVLRLMEYSKELEKRNEELTRVDRLKTEFLATTTHELRTPLNAILGTASLLSDTPLSEEQGGYVKTIERSTVAQLHLINDLLDTSKIQAGKLRIREAPFSLHECIEGALEMVAPAAADKELDLAYRVNCKLPERLVGDSRRLQQVILNLLSNAIKFTEEGEVELIIVSCDSMSSGRVLLVFDVRDTGIGIPPLQIGELFSLFSQLDSSSTRRYEGSGLGLYLTARLVSLMSGAISVSSDGTHGSTFHVQLLLSTAAASPQPARNAFGALLSHKHGLVLAASSANRQLFADQLPTVSATVDCVAVERRATALPEAVTPARVALADFVVAELSLVPAVTQLLPLLSPAKPRIIVPLTTALSWTKYSAKQQLVPLLKPLSHTSLLRTLHHALETPKEIPTPRSTEAPSAKQQPQVLGRILVVDDNAVLCQILTKSNYITVSATNGAEAIAVMRREPIDLVLMDLFMPVMDGFDCTRELRRLGYQCPIIAVSATINEEACLEVGISEFLHKPITKNAVIGIVHRSLTEVKRTGSSVVIS